MGDDLLASSLILVLIIQAKKEIANKYKDTSPNLLSVYPKSIYTKYNIPIIIVINCNVNDIQRDTVDELKTIVLV